MTGRINLRNIFLVVVLWALCLIVQYYTQSTLLFTAVIILLILQCIREFFKLVNTVRFHKPFAERATILAIVVVLTVAGFTKYPANAVFYGDFFLFKSKREMIARQFKNGLIAPNDPYGARLYQLPYPFPVLSLNNNSVVLDRARDGSVRVSFFTAGGNSDETKLVYSEDRLFNETVKQLSVSDPVNNEQLTDCWFRTDYIPKKN